MSQVFGAVARGCGVTPGSAGAVVMRVCVPSGRGGGGAGSVWPDSVWLAAGLSEQPCWGGERRWGTEGGAGLKDERGACPTTSTPS